MFETTKKPEIAWNNKKKKKTRTHKKRMLMSRNYVQPKTCYRIKICNIISKTVLQCSRYYGLKRGTRPIAKCFYRFFFCFLLYYLLRANIIYKLLLMHSSSSFAGHYIEAMNVIVSTQPIASRHLSLLRVAWSCFASLKARQEHFIAN